MQGSSAYSPSPSVAGAARVEELPGFFVLTPAFPWGLLVLLDFDEAGVKAEVLRFFPREGGGFEEVTVPLFRLTLDSPDSASGSGVAPWLAKLDCEEMSVDAVNAKLMSVDPLTLCSHMQDARHFKDFTIAGGTVDLCRFQQAFRFVASSEEASTFVNTTEAWLVNPPLDSIDALRKRTELMLQTMLGDGKVPCDLALIRSPADYTPPNADFPGVRPGLYVGNYGHGCYGQFGTEVLLLEYVSLTHEEFVRELKAPSGIFSRPQGEGPPSSLSGLCTLNKTITFLKITKQCGDKHVPMGATTIVAVIDPAEARAALIAGSDPPSTINNDQTNAEETVVRAWCGYGTLAFPGFQRPSWDTGWLVQLPDDTETGTHRFGFVFGGGASPGATVLNWIRAQEAFDRILQTSIEKCDDCIKITCRDFAGQELACVETCLDESAADVRKKVALSLGWPTHSIQIVLPDGTPLAQGIAAGKLVSELV